MTPLLPMPVERKTFLWTGAIVCVIFPIALLWMAALGITLVYNQWAAFGVALLPFVLICICFTSLVCALFIAVCKDPQKFDMFILGIYPKDSLDYSRNDDTQSAVAV